MNKLSKAFFSVLAASSVGIPSAFGFVYDCEISQAVGTGNQPDALHYKLDTSAPIGKTDLGNGSSLSCNHSGEGLLSCTVTSNYKNWTGTFTVNEGVAFFDAHVGGYQDSGGAATIYNLCKLEGNTDRAQDGNYDCTVSDPTTGTVFKKFSFSTVYSAAIGSYVFDHKLETVSCNTEPAVSLKRGDFVCELTVLDDSQLKRTYAVAYLTKDASHFIIEDNNNPFGSEGPRRLSCEKK